MRNMRIQLAYLALAAVLVACGGRGGQGTGPGDDPPLLIVVSPPNVTIGVGQTTKFTAVVGVDRPPIGLRWASTNSSVAVVDSTGLATGVGSGTAYIEATLGSVAGESIVNVTPP